MVVSRLAVSATVAAVFVGFSAAARADLLIDDFTLTQVAQDPTSGDGPVTVGPFSATFFGTAGDRTLTVDKSEGPGPATIASRQFVPGLKYDQDSTDVGSLVTVAYGNFGTVDLTQGGVNAGLVFNNLRFVGSGIDLIVTMFSGTSSATVTLADRPNQGAASTLFIPFTDFGLSGTAIAATLTGLTVSFDGTSTGGAVSGVGADASMTGSLVAGNVVPEPTSALLAGIGAAGLAIARRRRTRVA